MPATAQGGQVTAPIVSKPPQTSRSLPIPTRSNQSSVTTSTVSEPGVTLTGSSPSCEARTWIRTLSGDSVICDYAPAELHFLTLVISFRLRGEYFYLPIPISNNSATHGPSKMFRSPRRTKTSHGTTNHILRGRMLYILPWGARLLRR